MWNNTGKVTGMQITGMGWRWRGGQLKGREGRDNPATKLKVRSGVAEIQ